MVRSFTDFLKEFLSMKQAGGGIGRKSPRFFLKSLAAPFDYPIVNNTGKLRTARFVAGLSIF